MLILDRLRMFRETLTGDFIASVEAERFADDMRAEHPREWGHWCQAIAMQHVAIELTRMERKRRARALAPSRMFAVAAEAGDLKTLGLFRVTFTVDDDNTRRPFGQMTAKDCRYAAGAYRRSGTHSLMMAAFLDVVAKRIKRRTVAQVLNEQQTREMLVSLGGNGHELEATAA